MKFFWNVVFFLKIVLRPDNLFVLTLKNLDSGWQFDCNHDGNILEVKEPVVIQLVVRYSKNFIRSSIHEDFRKCHSLVVLKTWLNQIRYSKVMFVLTMDQRLLTLVPPSCGLIHYCISMARISVWKLNV